MHRGFGTNKKQGRERLKTFTQFCPYLNVVDCQDMFTLLVLHWSYEARVTNELIKDYIPPIRTRKWTTFRIQDSYGIFFYSFL